MYIVHTWTRQVDTSITYAIQSAALDPLKTSKSHSSAHQRVSWAISFHSAYPLSLSSSAFRALSSASDRNTSRSHSPNLDERPHGQALSSLVALDMPVKAPLLVSSYPLDGFRLFRRASACTILRRIDLARRGSYTRSIGAVSE